MVNCTAVVAQKGSRTVMQKVDPNRESFTFVGITTAEGEALPPVIIVKGGERSKAFTEVQEALASHFDGKAKVFAKPNSHVVDASTFCLVLRHIAEIKGA